MHSLAILTSFTQKKIKMQSSEPVDLPGWTDGQNSESHQKKSCIIHNIIQSQCLDQLRTIVESGWDVNEKLSGYYPQVPLLHVINHTRHNEQGTKMVKLLLDHGANPNVAHNVNIAEYGEAKWVQRTALQEAARGGRPEVVKMLLDAGAKLTTSEGLQNPLVLALQHCVHLPDLIELLLRHGADPNDHDGQLQSIPLLRAIQNCTPHWDWDEGEDEGADDDLNVKLLLKHGANPNVAHNVYIGEDGEEICVQRTALHEAVRGGRPEVVKMLLDAGAKCTTSDGLQNPLALAHEKHNGPPAIIKLLLKHGVDPNDHDHRYLNTPLVAAITQYNTGFHESDQVVNIKLLFEHGANPYVTYKDNIGRFGEDKWVEMTPLHEAARQRWTKGAKILLDTATNYVTSDITENPLVVALQSKGLRNQLALALENKDCPTDLIKLLLKHGADPNYDVDEPRLLKCICLCNHTLFMQQELDMFFLHGGNINMEDALNRTALERVVRVGGHINSVRWLIRHGDDTGLKFTLLHENLRETLLYGHARFPETPLILLQAGMRVSPGVQTQLSNIETAISTWLQDTVDNADNYAYVYDEENIRRTVYGMLDHIEEEIELKTAQCNLKKCTFPEYWTQQMADLQEFSDESLQVYPKDTHIDFLECRQIYPHILEQIHRVQEFLSQPQSLQWYCRRCVRENLVSLQPSVVKKLPIPAILKRYILCHEL